MKPARPYTRHGLTAPMARVKLRGLAAIDRRTVAGRELVRWRRDLIGDLGGDAALSVQQQTLVDVVTRSRLMLEALDAWLLAQTSLVAGRGRHRGVVAVMRDRQDLADSIARVLGQLGLERVAPPVPSLAERMREGSPLSFTRAARGAAHRPGTGKEDEMTYEPAKDGRTPNDPDHTHRPGPGNPDTTKQPGQEPALTPPAPAPWKAPR